MMIGLMSPHLDDESPARRLPRAALGLVVWLAALVGTACPSSDPAGRTDARETADAAPSPDGHADAGETAGASVVAPERDASLLVDAPRETGASETGATCPRPSLTQNTEGCHDLANAAPFTVSALAGDGLVAQGGPLVPGIYDAVTSRTTNADAVGTRQRRALAILPGAEVIVWVIEVLDHANPPPATRATTRIRVEGNALVVEERLCTFRGNTVDRFAYSVLEGGLVLESNAAAGRTVTEYRRRCAF